MIQLPRRSVTRFFIPLIDVMTLLFCILLLMPVVKATGEGQQGAQAGDTGPDQSLTAEDAAELQRLRRQRKAGQDLQQLQQEKSRLAQEVQRLQTEKVQSLEQHLAIRVLEIGEQGKLFYFDPDRPEDRRIEITAANVRPWLEAQERSAGGKDVYFLILYPRRASGFPGFPTEAQKREFERWFRGVAHGYDIPYRIP